MGRKTRALLSGLVCAAMSVTAVAQTVSAETLLKGSKLENATTQEILVDMGIGWNLGNSLDATYSTGLYTETSWGNPKTTQALISKVKSLGFNTVRIPVSWSKHVNGQYEIEEDWLNRVKEVVDYCYNEDMYVILNTHHDCQPYTSTISTTLKGYIPNSKNKEMSEKYLDTVWGQVAECFKDYDYHLIFETMNEPRLRGSGNEWWFDKNNLPSAVKDSIECINYLNQSAVDVIRASGGYNEGRLIMCPGYDASVDGATVSSFKLPTDISGNENRLVVSVHGYSPYDFAMGNVAKYNATQKSNLKNWTMKPLNTTFISKGIPVVMGEFSATAAKDLEERKKWAEDYAAQASAMNLPIILWDNNAFNKTTDNGSMNSECHGYVNRSDNTVSNEQQAVLDILMAPYKALEAERKAAMPTHTEVEINCAVAGLDESDYSIAGLRAARIYNADNSFSANCNLNTGSSFSLDLLEDGEYMVELSADNCAAKTTSFTVVNGEQVAPVNETINLVGDINGDGKANTTDLMLLKRHMLFGELGEYEQACADTSRNGKIDLPDVSKLKRHMINIQSLWVT